MEVQQQFGDQVTILGVPGLASAADFPEFIDSTGTASLTHIPDEQLQIWGRFGVTQQRTYVYINDDGTFERAGYGNLAGDVAAPIAR